MSNRETKDGDDRTPVSHPPLPSNGGAAMRAVFGPDQVAAMSAAYKAALIIASEENGPFATIPALELRRRLSRVIIIEAQRGIVDVDLLKTLALRGLHLRDRIP
ncbi:MAG: hypothetical protein PGN34_25970 [Methylobacterium frigidaeris]